MKTKILEMMFMILVILQQFFNANGALLPSFAESVPNVTVTVGKDALLPCVVDNLGHFKVAWVHVDTQTILSIHTKVISRNPRVTLAQSSHRHWYLRIKSVEPGDRGFYMCQVNTDPMRFTSGYLEVLVPPTIVDGGVETEVVVKEGSNVTLSCQANGHPEPKITWKREDGNTFNYHGKQIISVEGETLHLSKTSRLHMGPYLCIASNGVPPSVSQRIFVKVQFPPMLWIPNQLEAAYEGQDVMLVCHIEAFPKSISYWTTARGDIIISGEKYEVIISEDTYRVYMRLKIRNISPRDFGTYKCVAKNSLGDTDGTIKIQYLAPATTTALSTTHLRNEVTNTVRHAKEKAKKKLRNNKKVHTVSRSEAYEDNEQFITHNSDGSLIEETFEVITAATASTFPMFSNSRSSSSHPQACYDYLLIILTFCFVPLLV